MSGCSTLDTERKGALPEKQGCRPRSRERTLPSYHKPVQTHTNRDKKKGRYSVAKAFSLCRTSNRKDIQPSSRHAQPPISTNPRSINLLPLLSLIIPLPATRVRPCRPRSPLFVVFPYYPHDFPRLAVEGDDDVVWNLWHFGVCW
jgi:hypothetical protein